MTLGIELCFQPDATAETWARILDTVFALRPALAPKELKRLSDPDAPRREPWTATWHGELARRLDKDTSLAWTVICANASLLIHREPAFVKLAMLIEASPAHAADELTRLVTALATAPGGARVPALAMAFDPDMEADRALVLEQLEDAPPVLFVAGDAIARVGGVTKLCAAGAREFAGGLVLADRDAARGALALPLALFD